MNVFVPKLGMNVDEFLAGSERKADDRYELVDVRSLRCAIVHHERNAAGKVATRVVKDGDIALDPPGLSVSMNALLG